MIDCNKSGSCEECLEAIKSAEVQPRHKERQYDFLR